MHLLPLLALGGLLAAEPASVAPARATLDAWLAAQNQGQFESYAALYASKFSGVKRSGPRVRRMDRKAWLQDRQAMFKKKMNVSASNVVLTLAGGAADVSFVQRWESGKYKDEGQKRMLLVLEGTQFRIAQEEMLASKVEGQYLASEQAMLVLDGEVVLTTRVDKSWAVGPATAGAGFIGHRAVDVTRLPEGFRAWAGKPVEVFDAAAKSCTASIGGFELQARAEWHFGTVENWKTASKSAIASEVWAQAQPLLVAHLRDKKGPCGQPVFGRVVGSSTTPVIPFQEVKGPLLSVARDKAKAALADKAKGEDLSQLQGFQMAKHPADAAQSLLFISLDPELCADQESLSAELLWRVDPAKQPALFTPLSNGDADRRQALLAVDLDGDGQLEVIYQGWPTELIGILSLPKAGQPRRVFVSIPYFDCPC